jgi:hypothetical protein
MTATVPITNYKGASYCSSTIVASIQPKKVRNEENNKDKCERKKWRRQLVRRWTTKRFIVFQTVRWFEVELFQFLHLPSCFSISQAQITFLPMTCKHKWMKTRKRKIWNRRRKAWGTYGGVTLETKIRWFLFNFFLVYLNRWNCFWHVSYISEANWILEQISPRKEAIF